MLSVRSTCCMRQAIAYVVGFLRSLFILLLLYAGVLS